MGVRDRGPDRAVSLLENVKPDILKLLGGSPDFGLVGIDIIFHEGEISRVVSRMEISKKPRTGGAG